jgi:hypothetical protein
MATRNKAARASGKRGGSSDVTTGERDATLVDAGDINQQTAYLNRQNGTEDSSEKTIQLQVTPLTKIIQLQVTPLKIKAILV